MSRTFEHFPNQSKCPICGTNDDRECILAPIDGTEDGNISEAIPVHVECILNGVRYSEFELIYAKATKGEAK